MSTNATIKFFRRDGAWHFSQLFYTKLVRRANTLEPLGLVQSMQKISFTSKQPITLVFRWETVQYYMTRSCSWFADEELYPEEELLVEIRPGKFSGPNCHYIEEFDDEPNMYFTYWNFKKQGLRIV